MRAQNFVATCVTVNGQVTG